MCSSALENLLTIQLPSQLGPRSDREIATRYTELCDGFEELPGTNTRTNSEIMETETEQDHPTYDFVSFVYENGHIKLLLHWPKYEGGR
jgi:hypothetical protein